MNGNTVFSQKKLEKIYLKYLFRCIYKKDINELVKTLRVFYQNKGYSLVRVFLDQKSNLDTGDLFIEISNVLFLIPPLIDTNNCDG